MSTVLPRTRTPETLKTFVVQHPLSAAGRVLRPCWQGRRSRSCTEPFPGVCRRVQTTGPDDGTGGRDTPAVHPTNSPQGATGDGTSNVPVSSSPKSWCRPGPSMSFWTSLVGHYQFKTWKGFAHDRDEGGDPTPSHLTPVRSTRTHPHHRPSLPPAPGRPGVTDTVESSRRASEANRLPEPLQILYELRGPYAVPTEG